MREKMQRVVAEHNGGTLARTDGMNVAQFLDKWIEHKEHTSKVKPKTLLDYSRISDVRIKSAVGNVPLDKLHPLDVQHLVRVTQEKSSASEASRALRYLRMASMRAVKWQMPSRNVAEFVDLPKVPKSDMQVWDAGEAARFLVCSSPHALNALFHLALTLGMRVGELQGLRWQDVDFDKAELHVRQTAVKVRGKLSFGPPKSEASRRTINLSREVVEILRRHRERQDERRGALGEKWQDFGLVFASEVGTPRSNSNIGRMFRELVRRAEVSVIRLHDLRHTAATAMMRRGCPPKMVADILGHDDPTFTLHKYAKVWAEQRRELVPSAAHLYGAEAKQDAAD